MAKYRNVAQDFDFEMPDDATAEQINTKNREMAKARQSLAAEAATARNQARTEMGPVLPGAVTPPGQQQAQKMAQQAEMAALEEFMGPMGAPEPAMPTHARNVMPRPGQLGKLVAGMAPSLAGAAGGAQLGLMAAPFLGPAAPAGPVIGGALGSLLGEYTAQKTGLTEESDLGLALAALPIPGSAMTRRTAQMLPGAAKGIRAAASPLYETAEKIATQAGVKIIPTETAKTAAKATAEVTGVEMATAGMRSLAKKGERVGAKLEIPYATFRDEMQALGKRVGQLRVSRGAEYGQAKDLFKSSMTDLVTALDTAPPEVAKSLRQAIRLSKRAEHSEAIARRATQLPVRIALGGAGLFGGGLTGGAAGMFAPDIIRAGLETRTGTKVIYEMARNGKNLDQIANALVQLTEGIAQMEPEAGGLYETLGVTP